MKEKKHWLVDMFWRGAVEDKCSDTFLTKKWNNIFLLLWRGHPELLMYPEYGLMLWTFHRNVQDKKQNLYYIKKNIICIGTNKYLWINLLIQFLLSQISRGQLGGTMKRIRPTDKFQAAVLSEKQFWKPNYRNLLRSPREKLKSSIYNTKKRPLWREKKIRVNAT